MAYNVLIVDGQDMPRRLFEIYIDSNEKFNRLFSLANASDAVDVCRNMPVELILMDAEAGSGQSGLDAAETIKQQFPDIKIIMVTSLPEYSWPERARRIGADSFWYKSQPAEDILDVMERTMAGEHVYPDNTPLVKIGSTANHNFTNRELDVLKELTTGDSNALIAERLGISSGTVKTHVQHMLDKTGFKTRTELAAEARGLGIVIR